MKFAIVLLIAVVGTQAITLKEANSKWTQFKTQHQKSYSPIEERVRFNIFKNNLAEIEEHNQKFENGEETWKMGVTKFTDLTKEEFLKYVNKYKLQKPKNIKGRFVADPSIPAAATVDWRTKNVLTPVKDQGQCGSCWAFSTTGSLEAQNALNTGKIVSLSEQQLVDCSGDYENDGCDGGLMDYAFQYIEDNGIVKESDYPYTAQDGECDAEGKKVASQISGYQDVDSTESALQSAVQQVGPISVAIDATDKLQNYESGILNDNTCNTQDLNHGVLAVGYGEDDGVSYWIVKNSWGADWGENGYFRLSRARSNPCGIAEFPSYPLL